MISSFYPELTSIHKAARLLVGIKQVIMLNKLAARRDYWGRDLSMVASGDQIMNHMEPGIGGFASYYLMSIALEIDCLKSGGYIIEQIRQEGPSGYGDEQEFMLTPKALALGEGKTSEEFRWALTNDLHRALYGNSFSIDDYHDPV